MKKIIILLIIGFLLLISVFLVRGKFKTESDSSQNEGNGKVLEIKDSFEQKLLGWGKPHNCSVGAPGEPLFTVDFSDDATDGKKSLNLTSDNHNLCIDRMFELEEEKVYRLSFDAKHVTGESPPSFYLCDEQGELKYLNSKTDVLADGWERYTVVFKTRTKNAHLYFYSGSKGEKNTILYDNIRIKIDEFSS